MKQKFSQILDEFGAGELSILLDKTHSDPLDPSAAARIREKVFSNTRLPEQAPEKKMGKSRRAMGALAACFVILISVGIGTYAYAAEIREYNDAVQFFHDYNLSTEGLTRGEIKAVYRDITTASFTYSKTAEVIEESLSASQVSGYEILQDNPTPEDVENLWNYKKNSGGYGASSGDPAEGVHYAYFSSYKPDRLNGYELFDGSLFEKYDGDTLIWSVPLPEFQVKGYSIASDGVIVYGDPPSRSSDLRPYAWIVKIDSNGSLIWKHKHYYRFDMDTIAAILENDDGTHAVISRGSLKYFCLSQYTADGNLTHFQMTEIGNYGIWNVVRFGDGYLVQLGSILTKEYAKIIKVDHKGNITDSFSFRGEDADYYITGMIEFDGEIYLSAYAVPKLGEEGQLIGGRYEIAPVLNYLYDNDIWEISSEELTPLVRANYTAMLLVCDPGEGTPREFYSVPGSLGGRLALSDAGTLLWDVESITTTFYSPGTSSFSIGGTCYVFRYTFDDNGTLISQEKTGEITDYRR